ncbi:MAG: FAD-dependent monooxygenase [Mariprofundales bacterium]
MNSNAMKACDIAIVGGGAVGSALAIDLLARGFNPLVLEARRFDYSVRPPEREIALSAGSICYLKQLAIWSHLLEQGVGEIAHIRVVEAGESASVSLDSGGGDPLGCVVEMGQLLQPMHALLGERLLAPAQLVRWDLCSDGVKLSCTINGKERLIQAKVLVAADGSNSQVRRMAGIAVAGWDHNRFGLVASVTTTHGHHNTAHECFRPQGPLALLPMADDRFSLVWAVAPRAASALMAMDDADLIAQLTQSLDPSIRQQIGTIEAITPRAVFPLELTIAQRFTAPRVALVGNAAHTIHPVAGQGMNLGLRDTMALAQVMANTTFDDVGHAMVLTQYAETRRQDVMMTVGFTESLLTTFATAGGMAKWLRQAGLRAVEQGGGLRHLLMDYATGEAQVQS